MLGTTAAALLNRSDEEELECTREMVENNFSSYSAWHNRRRERAPKNFRLRSPIANPIHTILLGPAIRSEDKHIEGDGLESPFASSLLDYEVLTNMKNFAVGKHEYCQGCC